MWSMLYLARCLNGLMAKEAVTHLSVVKTAATV